MNAAMIAFLLGNAGVLAANAILARESFRAQGTARAYATVSRQYAEAVQEGSMGRLAGPDDVKDSEFGETR